jgi:hypothetical protein
MGQSPLALTRRAGGLRRSAWHFSLGESRTQNFGRSYSCARARATFPRIPEARPLHFLYFPPLCTHHPLTSASCHDAASLQDSRCVLVRTRIELYHQRHYSPDGYRVLEHRQPAHVCGGARGEQPGDGRVRRALAQGGPRGRAPSARRERAARRPRHAPWRRGCVGKQRPRAHPRHRGVAA